MKLIKKLLLGVLSGVSALALFSCADVSPDTALSASAMGEVRVSLAEISSRTAFPSAPAAEFDSCTLKYKESGSASDYALLATWNGSESQKSVALAEGTYDFYLACGVSSTVYSGTLSGKEVTAGETTMLAFRLYLTNFGTGSGSVSVTLAVDDEVLAVKAGLYDAANLTTAKTGFAAELLTISNKKVVYEKTGVPAGNWILIFDLYSDAQATAKIKSVYEAVNVASGLSSASTVTVSSYTVNYDTYYTALPTKLQSVIPANGRVKDVVIPKKVVSITDDTYKNLVETTYFKDFDDTEYTKLWTGAIQKAIDDLSAAGGGHLLFPAGTYLSGPIVLKSNVDLHLEKGAVLLASPNKKLYWTTGAKHYFIYASKCTNISISGEGTIDGNGEFWWPITKSHIAKVKDEAETEALWEELQKRGGVVADSNKGETCYPWNESWADRGAACMGTSATEQESSYRNVYLLRFEDSTNVAVKGITLKNSPKMHFFSPRLKNVIIDGVTIDTEPYTPNTDALDICMSQNVLIVNCNITCGDDGIVMKGGDVADTTEDANENILITNNTTRKSHTGFALGSQNTKGLKNTVVYGNEFNNSAMGGISFKTPAGCGGITEKVYIYHNIINNPKNAISFDTAYEDAGIGGSSTGGYDKSKYLPDLHDVYISDLTVTAGNDSNGAAIYVYGLSAENPVHHIFIANSTFTGFSPAISLTYAKDISITDCTFDKGIVSIDDDTCHGITFTGSTIAGEAINWEEDTNTYSETISWDFKTNPSTKIVEGSSPSATDEVVTLKTEKGKATLAVNGKVAWQSGYIATGNNKVTAANYSGAGAYFDLTINQKSTIIFTAKAASSSYSEQRFAVITDTAATPNVLKGMNLPTSDTPLRLLACAPGTYRLYLNGSRLTGVTVKLVE